MSLFQTIATVVFAALASGTAAGLLRRRSRALESLTWLAVWLIALAAVLNPGLTQTVARAMGIGRGADLVLYLTVIATLVGFLMVYARLQRLRRDVTLVVRQLALLEAERDRAAMPGATPDKPPA